MAKTTPSQAKNEPCCTVCRYVLTGLTDSGRCPECRQPLVDVLARPGQASRPGGRYQSRATLFGLPVLAIAFGPWYHERIGHARGIIALGDRATGWLAIGGAARGGVAEGGGVTGWAAPGGGAWGAHTISRGGASSGRAQQVFDQFVWFFCTWRRSSALLSQPLIVVAGATIARAMLLAVLGLVTLNRTADSNQ